MIVPAESRAPYNARGREGEGVLASGEESLEDSAYMVHVSAAQQNRKTQGRARTGPSRPW